MIRLRAQQHARGDDVHLFLHEEEQGAAEHAAEELGGEAPVEAWPPCGSHAVDSTRTAGGSGEK